MPYAAFAFDIGFRHIATLATLSLRFALRHRYVIDTRRFRFAFSPAASIRHMPYAAIDDLFRQPLAFAMLMLLITHYDTLFADTLRCQFLIIAIAIAASFSPR